MGVKLSQRLRVQGAVLPQDIQAARTSAFVPIAGSGQILTAVTTAALIAGRKATVQFMQARDAAGTDAKPLGDPVDKTAVQAGPVAFTAEAYTERLSDGFGFVAVQLSSNNGAAVLGSAMLISGNNRFNP